MSNQDLRAKVFISCGQNKNSDESKLVELVKETIESLGFIAYVAIHDHALKGVVDNIIPHLETSDYFLFIDFERELLLPQNKKIDDINVIDLKVRGSLFCHQELALATHFGLDVLPFQQGKRMEVCGMASAMQVNFIPFNSSKELIGLLKENVKKLWDKKSKNKLTLQAEKPSLNVTTPGGILNFYHVNVKNLHTKKIAEDCRVYIDLVKEKPSGRLIPLNQIELKWTGFTFPSATILPSPNNGRKFDAFVGFHNQPNLVKFLSFTDSSQYVLTLKKGDYELEYLVVSKNFPIEKATFQLHVDDSLDKLKFL
jgi:hypothetical protein